MFVCVARYKYLTPTEPAASFKYLTRYRASRSSSLEAPADMLPGLTLFKTVLDFLKLALG